jgi:catechol 2,3-dioxygenase-like lactoylglutathione lyase family enzyme
MAPDVAIARWALVALDCPDAQALAGFYSALTGWPVAVGNEIDDEWVFLDAGGGPTIAFQEVPEYVPPQWPGQDHPQQAHLDFDVPDLDAAQERVLALGAILTPTQPGESWRVFLDPAGHPFCLVERPGME